MKNDSRCRFKFPHPSSQNTLIARPTEDESILIEKKEIRSRILKVLNEETTPANTTLEYLFEKYNVDADEYKKCLKSTRRGMSIVLKRRPSKSNINFYNLDLLRIWRANMDLQFILDPYACIIYITLIKLGTHI